MVPNVRRKKLESEIVESVEFGAVVYTDELPSYSQLHGPYTHRVIKHAESYAKGQVHTNGLENFWSLLKRSIKGTYVSVEPFHLFRYLDEQVYKFNNRQGTDADRFVGLARSIVGRRVTFSELTGSLLCQRKTREGRGQRAKATIQREDQERASRYRSVRSVQRVHGKDPAGVEGRRQRSGQGRLLFD